MENQKIDNLLNVSLSSSKEELEKSPDLSTGINLNTGIWELIVRYTDAGLPDISFSLFIEQKYENTTVYELLNHFAIIETKKEFIESLSDETCILYVEKPKLLYYELIKEKESACITPVQELYKGFGIENVSLYGKGIITAIIDSGIDITDMEFRNADGTTRIIELWDQEENKYYGSDEINTYLSNSSPKKNNDKIPGNDLVKHGNFVSKIACGKSGVASQSKILVVKLGVGNPEAKVSFPRTTQIMRAFDYCIRKASQLNLPETINLSIGNNYGSHLGSDILDSYLDSVSGIGKISICVGCGNEGLGIVHTSGELKKGINQTIELLVGEFEENLSVQIWKDYIDDFEVEIITPTEKKVAVINRYNELVRSSADMTDIMSYFGEPTPYNGRQQIYIEMIPDNNYILSGIWKIVLKPLEIKNGKYDIWLPTGTNANEKTGFLEPVADMTFTTPSTTSNVISVGAYNSSTLAIAGFSGRGYAFEYGGAYFCKPDIVAPGVNIDLGDGVILSGTSFAAPFVTGASALLMEWGITMGNDPYLYAAKLKEYLIKGAKRLPGFKMWPNRQAGWGALCVSKSLPD